MLFGNVSRGTNQNEKEPPFLAAPFRFFRGMCLWRSNGVLLFYITDGAHAEYAGAVLGDFVRPLF